MEWFNTRKITSSEKQLLFFCSVFLVCINCYRLLTVGNCWWWSSRGVYLRDEDIFFSTHYFINSACLYICFFFVFSFCIYICAQIYPILIIFLNGVNSSLIFCSCKEPSLFIKKSVNNNNKLYSWPFKKSVCSKLLIFDPPRPCLFVFACPSQNPSLCTPL